MASLVDAVGGHRVIGEATNGRDALNAAERLEPDVVLMDIRMPGMDGLEAATRLARQSSPPAVIFITAFGDHALEAFETAAIDYLLKPVRRDRLAEALHKARQLNRAQLDALMETEASEGGRQHILCRRRGGLELIPIETVRFFQADQKYITVNHEGGEDLIEDSLKRLEEAFGDSFVRIHRNALVARKCLQGLEKGSDGRPCAVLRDTDQRLEVSRRHLPRVRDLLRNSGR
jgi:two-component system response regulator AlgR